MCLTILLNTQGIENHLVFSYSKASALELVCWEKSFVFLICLLEMHLQPSYPLRYLQCSTQGYFLVIGWEFTRLYVDSWTPCLSWSFVCGSTSFYFPQVTFFKFIFLTLIKICLRSSMIAEGDSIYYYLAMKGLVASCAKSSNYVTCNILSRNMGCPTKYLMLYLGFGGLAVSLVSSAFDSKNLVLSSEISSITFSSWVRIFAVAMMGISAICTLYKSIALSNAVLVSFIRVFDIVIAYIIQIIFLHQAFTTMGIVGSCLVVSAIIMLGLEQSFVKLLPVRLQTIFWQLGYWFIIS